MIKQREANSWKSVSYAKSITGAQTYTKFPIVLRTTQQSIPTWNVKGNTETSGTPSPSNPITIDGVGNRTANLFSGDFTQFDNTGGTGTSYAYFGFSGNMTIRVRAKGDFRTPTDTYLGFTANGGGSSGGYVWAITGDSLWTEGQTNTIRSSTNSYQFLSMYAKNATTLSYIMENFEVMLNEGDTALPYEPYGYKIPLSSNGTALAPVYLSNQLMKIGDTVDTLASSGTVTYNISKFKLSDYSWTDYTDSGQLMFLMSSYITNGKKGQGTSIILCDSYEVANSRGGLIGTGNNNKIAPFNTSNSNALCVRDDRYTSAADWIAANGDIVVYYVVETPTTETVTAPSITTTSGLNTIDVNTTVKPSEMSLTYNGWRINKQKKKSENLCNGMFEQNSINIDGDLTQSASRVKIFMDVKQNTQYTFNSNEYLRIIYGYNGDTKVGIILDTSESAPKSYTFTTAATVNKIGISLMNNAYSSSATAIVPSDVQNAMLNEGPTALPYAPYWE